ncbi:MAG: radical SAM protein [Butyrivibrio sp.]|nr:radical SAM protein [Butyrivibrio sp.]
MKIRAAFATSTGFSIDRHFGAADRFDIYEIDREQKTFEKIDTRLVERACLEHKHNEERMSAVAGTIDDCNAVFAECIGGGARNVLEKLGIEPIEMDYSVMKVLSALVKSTISIVDPRYLEQDKKRKETVTGNSLSRFKHLSKEHPCMSHGAHVTKGRIHLPVSPKCNIGCRFCTRKMDKSVIRPGVSSLVLKPEESIEIIRKAKKLCPQLSVVGIAGPGDTLATTSALDTFELVKKEFPDMISCLSTNGFRLYDRLGRISELGIETITVTVNAVDPEIEAKINDFVIDENGVLHTGIEAAKLLIENQKKGIEKAAKMGIVVKINSVLVPGINDHHIPEVARQMHELGASLMNILPLIPQNKMADIPAPDCEMLERVRSEAGRYLEIFRHCKHCRADAIGIPGTGKDLHTELYKDYDLEPAETFSHG